MSNVIYIEEQKPLNTRYKNVLAKCCCSLKVGKSKKRYLSRSGVKMILKYATSYSIFDKIRRILKHVRRGNIYKLLTIQLSFI